MKTRKLWYVAASCVVLVLAAWFVIPAERVTPENAARLTAGMSAEQVCAILGPPDDPWLYIVPRMEGIPPGSHGKMWAGRDARIAVVFGPDGKVLQFGVQLVPLWESPKLRAYAWRARRVLGP
jgi:hypothetical protein